MGLASIQGGALGAAAAAQRESTPAPTAGGESFGDALGRVVGEANRAQVDASGSIRDLLVNGTGSIHDAMIAVNRADASFRLLMEMRNRLIEGVNQLLETRL
jgi:flagellar hook-basal body complex protein FliE